MTLSQWEWVKRGSLASRFNDALYKCDTCCSFLLFFNHGNSLKIRLTLLKSCYIWIAFLYWKLYSYRRAQCSLFLQNIIYLFHFCLLLSFSFTSHAEDPFFLYSSHIVYLICFRQYTLLYRCMLPMSLDYRNNFSLHLIMSSFINCVSNIFLW